MVIFMYPWVHKLSISISNFSSSLKLYFLITSSTFYPYFFLSLSFYLFHRLPIPMSFLHSTILLSFFFLFNTKWTFCVRSKLAAGGAYASLYGVIVFNKFNGFQTVRMNYYRIQLLVQCTVLDGYIKPRITSAACWTCELVDSLEKRSSRDCSNMHAASHYAVQS